MKQPTEHPHHDLPLDEDIKLAEKSWPIQRIGWGLLLLFVLSASAGLFGNGLLSTVNDTRGNYQIEYERFGRYEMPQQVTVHAKAVNGKVTLLIGQHFMKDYDIQLMTPKPRTELFRDDNILLEFDANASVTLVFMLEAQRSGRIKAPISLNGQVFQISQFIYP